MATPTPFVYKIVSGKTARIGRAAPGRTGPVLPVSTLGSITTSTNGQDVPWNQQLGRPLVLHLHASGGPADNGIRYAAQVDGRMSFPGFEEFVFNLVPAASYPSGVQTWHITLRPNDTLWGVANAGRQSMHMGFQRDDGYVHLIAERRYDAGWKYAQQNYTQYDLLASVCEGGSMGAWGAATYGIRRPEWFAATYCDRPRFRYGFNVGEVPVANWENISHTGVPVAQSPLIHPDDGGGTLAEYRDMIAYVSNPENPVNPILWVIGRNDYFATFDDTIGMIDACRARGVPFAVAWNNGGHGGGDPAFDPPSKDILLEGYPYGTFRLDRGCLAFSEHSLDKDPRVDLVGEINIGPKFRNIVETESGFTAEVSSWKGASTFKAKPYGCKRYKVDAPAKLVTITTANQWQTISFNAQGL